MQAGGRRSRCGCAARPRRGKARLGEVTLGRSAGLDPGQRRVDAHREIARTERLDDIVVGSRGDSGRDVSLLRQGCQDDDRDIRRGRILAEFLAHLQAGHPGHHDVKDGQVRRMLAGVGQGGQAVPEPPDLVTGLRELEGHEKPDVGVIFGQKNRGHPYPRGCSDAAGAKSAPAPVSFATWAAAAAARHYV